MATPFFNTREPIEKVVDEYFKKQSFIKRNMGEYDSTNISLPSYMDEALPEYPVHFVRNDAGLVERIIYGDLKALEEAIQNETEASPIIWQEEIVRNAEGQTVAIENTYPDGIVTRIDLVRENDRVTGVEIGDSP